MNKAFEGLDYVQLAMPLFTVKMSKSNCNSAVQMFLRSGHSHHTRHAACLGAVIRYCEINKIAYTLKSRPGFGYSIERDLNPEVAIYKEGEDSEEQTDK